VNSPFVLAGVTLGAVLAAAYFVSRLKNGEERNIEDVIGVFGYGVGLLGGIQVCWISYSYRAAIPIENISVQMFAGGFALGWFAINGIVKKFKGD
jgi:lipid-A-disaccharide synthase-like uncharacterized protein